MPIDPHNFLRALSDRFTPVRSLDGTLIGCVPRVHESAQLLTGSNGAAFELRIAAQVCVCINPDDALQSPNYLDGFIPLHDTTPGSAPPSRADGEDPDLAIGV